MSDYNMDTKSIYTEKYNDQRVQQPTTQGIKFCDVWTDNKNRMILTISNSGEVWINPDLKFSNLEELRTDYLLTLRALVNKAIEEKLK